MSGAASMREGGGDIVQLTAFMVGDEEYVVDIMRVREIVKLQPITPVRRGPKFVEGVINLRGAVIPVLDLRRRFDLPVTDLPHRKIIIMNIDRRTVGCIVDRVTDVVRVARDAIKPAPGLLDEGRAPYFLGVCHHGRRTLILLNVRQVILSEDAVVPAAIEMPHDLAGSL